MKTIFNKLGADTEYGYWPINGYDFQYSKAIINGKFCGLAIDDINQPELTEKRVIEWAKQIKKEMNL